MQAIYDREIHSLSISMPPRAGKSYITSLYCAWFLGKRPAESVMRNTCTATLYDKLSYDTRNVLRHEKYAAVFPESKLAEDRQNVSGWNLQKSRQVGYFGAGVGGTIIGFGCSGVAITDDLYKSLDDALSETTNSKVHSWKQATHDSRLEQDAEGHECPIIDIGTRWSTQDVIGKGIEEGKYDKSIVISALDKDGKSFCEHVHTTEYYTKKKLETEQEIWDAEYMQSPAEIKGKLFPAAELQYFKLSELRKQDAHGVIAYTDPADEGTDNFSMPVGYVFPNTIYVTDVVFTTEGTDISCPEAIDLLSRIPLNYVRVEGNGGGIEVYKEFRKHMPDKTLKVNNTTNKHARIFNSSMHIKRNVKFLAPGEYAPGSPYDLFMQQITKYMKDGSVKKDDAPDSVSGLVSMARSFYPDLFK